MPKQPEGYRCDVSSSVLGEGHNEKSSRLSWHYAGQCLHELRKQVRIYKSFQDETISRWSSRSSNGLNWSYKIGTGPYKGIIEKQKIMKVCLSETHASRNREAFTCRRLSTPRNWSNLAVSYSSWKYPRTRNCRRRNVDLTCSRPRYTRCRTRITASFWRTRANSSQFHWIKFCRLCSLFVTMNQKSLPWCLPTWEDLLQDYLQQGAEATNSVLHQISVGKEEHGTFRFCGNSFWQDDGIHVTAKDNTVWLQPITYDAKHGLTRKATADEIHQLRSITQSLAWIAKQTRLDLSYRISKIQSASENVCARDPRECNRIVEFATSTSTRGIHFLQIFLGMMWL